MDLMNGLSSVLNYQDPNARFTPEVAMQPQMPSAPAVPKANGLSGPNPFTAPRPKMQNGLARTLDAFQRGFDPKGRQARLDENKAAEKEKGVKLLALAQAQRNLPEDQRAAWFQQNAPAISEIIGSDVSAMPLDPSQFSDQALDGHIAMLSGSLGMAEEPMTAYQRAQLAQKDRPEGVKLGGGAYAQYDPVTGKLEMLREPTPEAPDQSNYDTVTLADGVYAVNKNDPNDRIRIGAAPPRSGSAGGLTPYQQAQLERQERQDSDKAKEKERGVTAKVNNLTEGIWLVEQLLGDEGFADLYGWTDSPNIGGLGLLPADMPKMPGSKGANAEALLEQIGGQAFLAGVESMRGTGPLSDREGQAVKAARTRLLNRKQDDASARAAAADFIGSMRRLLNAYQQESAGGGSVLTPEQQAQAVARRNLPSFMQQYAQPQGEDDFDPALEAALDEAFGPDEDEDDVSDLLEKYR